MRNLSTKQGRTEMRKAWLQGKPTEKYKDLEILTEEKISSFNQKPIYYLTIWRGSAGNPCVNYSYRSKERMEEQITYYKKYADQREEYQRKRKEPKPEIVHNLKKGDIFYTSWGYDQTNYDYIVILEIRGKYAICQRTASLHMGQSCQSNVQEPIFCPFGDKFRMKIQGSCFSGDNSITLRGSYPFLHTGIIEDKYGGKSVRLDTFFQAKQGQQFHETMSEFGGL